MLNIAKFVNGLASLIVARDVQLLPERNRIQRPPSRQLSGPVQARPMAPGPQCPYPRADAQVSAQTSMQPDQRNPAHAQFDAAHERIIKSAWVQAVGMVAPANSEPYAVTVGTHGKWGLYTVKHPLKLSFPPTPSIVNFIEKNFLYALRQEMRTDDVMVRIVDAMIWVELPSPLPRPSTHVRHLLKYARPGVPLAQAGAHGDITGVVGIDNDRRVVRLDFAKNPVSLFVASPGNGKTTSLKGMLATVVEANGPDRVHLYIFAPKMDHWADFAKLPHTKVCTADDEETARVMWELGTMVETRSDASGRDGQPSIIVVFDDFSMFDIAPFRQPLKDLVLGGRHPRMYTIITSHRATEEGGINARFVNTAAEYRVALSTSGGESEFKRNLNANVKGVMLPKERGEALIGVKGFVENRILTCYMEDSELFDVVSVRSVDDSENLGGEGVGSSTDTYDSSSSPVDEQIQSDTSHLHDPEFTPPVPNEVPLSRTRKEEIYRLYGYECVYCGHTGENADGFHVDHIIPRAQGGSNENENLAPACEKCNLEKGATTAKEYFDRKLSELVGDLPRMRKKGRFYVPTSWDLLRVWYKHEVCGWDAKQIAKATQNGEGGNQQAKVQEWSDAGRGVYHRVAISQTDGIEDFLDEINRRMAENGGD